MTMVETCPVTGVTGGVDTHLDTHVAAALDQLGGQLGVESFPASPAGYGELLEWLGSFGPVQLVGIEGTGSYGAGLARHLRRAGVAVVEVDRPNRQDRHRHGKSDTIDAIAAAHAALSGRAQGAGKNGDGPIEAIRTLTVVKRSCREERIRTRNQIRQLAFCAPDDLREATKDLSRSRLAAEAARWRPRPGGDVVTYATRLAMATLGRRVQALEAEATRIDELLVPLVEQTAPRLLELLSVGPDTAAILLVAAGDNPERIRSEAAWAHLCGVAPIPRRQRARPTGDGSTGAGTAKPTTPSTGSSSPACATTNAPATTSNNASPPGDPNPRSSAASSATSPARSTATYPDLETAEAAGVAH